MVKTVRPLARPRDIRAARPVAKRADAELLTPEHKAWRIAVIKRAGWRCEAVENGQRCEVKHPARLFADHVQERKDGGAALDVGNGQCLCGRHHSLKTAQARAARMAQRY